MSLKQASLAFGIVFLVIGALGFVPALTPMNADGMPLLLGLFMVGAVHNIIHLVSGIGALLGSTSDAYAKLYFQIFGAVYALVTVVGFIQGNTVLGLINVNLADNLLHLVIAAAALYLGFGFRSAKSVSA
jgi:Domain of unknown function (DUF4383)